MGIFDMFRKKPDENPMTARMRDLAPILFPGGHQQIIESGKRISSMLDGRIPAESASKLFASSKYYAHTATDKTRENVIRYIRRGGMGILDDEQATQIYERFIETNSAPKSPVDTPIGVILEIFDKAKIDVNLDRGIPSALFIQITATNAESKTWFQDTAIVQKVVTLIERRIKAGDVYDISRQTSISYGIQPATADYSSLKRVVLTADNQVALHYNKKSQP
jgi:hypothetical protein